MSRYTTEYRFLFDKWDDEKLGLLDYPIFDESYRETLNKKIKNYFSFQEIGFETPARFVQRFKSKMEIIMPYHNQFYESNLRKIKPFINMLYGINQLESLQQLQNAQSLSDKLSKNSQNESSLNVENGLNDENSVQSERNKSSDIKNESSLKTGNKNENGNSNEIEDGKHVGLETENHNNTSNKTVNENGKSEKIETTGKSNYNVENVMESQTTTSADYTENNHTGHDDDINDGVKSTSFIVNSDTPEGFVQTKSIGDTYVYANTGTKSINEQDGTIKHSYNSGDNSENKSHGGQVNGRHVGSQGKEHNAVTSGGRDDKVVSDSGYDSGASQKNSDSDDLKNKITSNSVYGVDTDSVILGSENNSLNDRFSNNINVLKNNRASSANRSSGNLIKDIENQLKSDMANHIKNGNNYYSGFSGITMSKMLEEWRETFINIDWNVIRDLECLFIQVLN